jgi:hypothetical protein
VIMAPVNELDDAISTMTRTMMKASAVVTGGLQIPVEKSFEVRWPDYLGDVRKEKAKVRLCGPRSRAYVQGDLRQKRAR